MGGMRSYWRYRFNLQRDENLAGLGRKVAYCAVNLQRHVGNIPNLWDGVVGDEIIR